MAGVIANIPKFQFSANGVPMVGGTLDTYIAGSTTPATTWQDSALTIANTNPITLDARGECVLWLDPAVVYKFVLKNALGVVQWTQDNLSSAKALTDALRTDLAAASGASLVGFQQEGTGAVSTTVQSKLRESVSALDFGAVGDGVADNSTAFAKIKTAAESGKHIHFPKPSVHYASTTPLNFTVPVTITADPDTRIKLTSAANYVVQFDFTAGAGGFDHGARFENFILDGNGYALDGLSLKGVISSDFPNIRVTNVTRAGLHLWWAQLCTFLNFAVSNNIEPFTAVPVNGVLADTASSSANTFTNITIEKVSGDGVLAVSLINSVFINGTSEGNGGAGLVFGEPIVGSLSCVGNSVLLMDLEVNTGGDIRLLKTSSNCCFYGLASGYSSGSNLISGTDHKFYGGLIGSTHLTTDSSRNRFFGVNLLGAAATFLDDGANNYWTDIFNFSSAVVIREKGKGRGNAVLAAGQSVTFDATVNEYYVVTCSGATATINAPINARDGQEMVVCIHNNSTGALVVTWDAIFKKEGWVDPSVQTNRTATFRYDANYGKWYLVSVNATDVQNG